MPSFVSALASWWPRIGAGLRRLGLLLERVSLLALLAGAVGLVWYRNRVPIGWQAALWAMLVAALAVIFRRDSRRTFGPVFFYDLVRTSRHGVQIGHRCLYAILLLGLLFLVYWSWFPDYDPASLLRTRTISPSDRARFAGSFFMAFLAIQFAVVLLVTPTYTAGAIAEQKERRTLEFLLVTDLSNREIVMGALAARLGNLLLLVMTGLPFVSLLEFMGGVDPALLLAGFAATAMMTISLGAVSILVSVNARTSLSAVVGTYIALLALLIVSGIIPGLWYGNPLYALAYVGWYMSEPRTDLLVSSLAFCCLHGLLALICCRVAVTQVRRVARMQAGGQFDMTIAPVADQAASVEAGVTAEWGEGWGPHPPLEIPHPYVRREEFIWAGHRPPVGDDGLMWKEMHAQRRFNPQDPVGFFGYLFGAIALVMALIVLPVWFTALLAEALQGPEPFGEYTQPCVRGLTIGLSCVILPLIGLSAAHRISKERELQTLDSLLTIPADRTRILFAKWMGSILSTRRLWWFLGVVWVLGLLTGGLNPFAVPFLVAASIVYAAFVASMGLSFSTINRSTLRATLFTLLASLVVVIGPGILYKFVTATPLVDSPRYATTRWDELFFDYGLTPPLTLWTLSFRATDLQSGRDWRPLARLGAAVAGLHCYLAVAVILWLFTNQRLHAEKGPRPRRPKARAGE